MKPQINIKTVILLLLLTGLFSDCTNEKSSELANTGSNKTVKIQTVEVVNPQERSFTAEVLITGTAQPHQVVTMLAMESGMLTQINKDIGDMVKKGEVIAVLTNPEIDHFVSQMTANQAAKKAELATVQANLEVAEAKVTALKSMADRLASMSSKTPQLTTLTQVETASGDAKAAAAMVKSETAKVSSKLAEIKAIEMQLINAQKRKSFLQLRAPFSGVITKRYVHTGAMIQSGLHQQNPQAIVEIQATNPIRLTLSVPESEAAAVKKGMEVNISFPEMSGVSYPAKISRTANALDPMSKTMQVEIDLKNDDGRILSGMYAKALLRVSSRENILSLPIMAKVIYKNETYILVVEEGVVKRLPIKIGLSDKDYFEVLNAGINADSKVIVKGKGLVNPGQIVEPQISAQ